MNCTRLGVKAQFMVRRSFAKSRLEAEYLAKSYEMIVPVYRMGVLRRKEVNKAGADEMFARHPEGIGA